MTDTPADPVRLGIHNDISRTALEATMFDVVKLTKGFLVEQLHEYAKENGFVIDEETIQHTQFYRKWIPGNPDDEESLGMFVDATEEDYDTLRLQAEAMTK